MEALVDKIDTKIHKNGASKWTYGTQEVFFFLGRSLLEDLKVGKLWQIDGGTTSRCLLVQWRRQLARSTD